MVDTDKSTYVWCIEDLCHAELAMGKLIYRMIMWKLVGPGKALKRPSRR